MIAHLRRATVELGVPCRVLMDLAGPKLRTGALAPGPEVVKIRPTRDLAGNVVAPARVWLGEHRVAPTDVAASLPLNSGWVARLHAGDRIHLTDARGAKRSWRVERAGDGGALVLVDRTSYVASGTRLREPARAATWPSSAAGSGWPSCRRRSCGSAKRRTCRVVWATQVLEHLAKEGRPSRAEITDAAMSERAECVMLNKGPHLCDAVEVLDNILRRMEAHESKKRAMLRPLALAERFAGVGKT
jgi:pyruvate kinase